MEKPTAIYPGSFDPVHLGHVDVASRAAELFERVVIGLSVAPGAKRHAFDTAVRKAMLEEALSAHPNVEVRPFSGLLTVFARSVGAKVIIRGLRAVSDFEYELQMASMNRNLAPGIDTLFMMTSVPYAYLSSSLIKEVAGLGGSVRDLVPECARARIEALRREGD